MSDTQISDDKYYEDINNLLNIGEIPNLFAGEDKENVSYPSLYCLTNILKADL